jgi:hypothetical protein
MAHMRRAAVTELQERRERRISRAVAARRSLDRTQSEDHSRDRTGGRLWLNGTELGGTDPRHAPLALSYD